MRHKPNVGGVERVIRILGGGTAILVGVTLFIAGPANVFVGLALVALTLVGLDFLITGVTGYCPLYHRLGRSTVRHTGRHSHTVRHTQG